MVDVPAPDEPYQSLYRRYRPQRFGEVRGQEHVTRALRNAVRDARVAHAYLFSGPRGTGKTSTARILAMALNCANPVEGEPDGTCDSCVAIRRGSSLDVQELDAASNRGIDEMRDLLSRVALGIPGRWKVYIVDEVHQLTPVAASALLKTLEEPPSHVVFVLATTDPQKVLQTIRSRTQHFEFHLLGSETLAGLLREVNEAAALGVAPEAIDLVVRRGHGSARDALSVLDQVAALGEVGDESGTVSDIVDAVADHDPGRVLMAVAEAVGAGRDPRRLLTDLVEHLRDGFLAEEAPSLVMLADDAAAEAARQAGSLGRAGLVRALELLGRTGIDMRDAIDPRVTLEVALVRLAAPAADSSPDSLLRRLEHLEAQLARLAGAAPGAAVTAPGAPTAAEPPSAPIGSGGSEPARAAPADQSPEQLRPEAPGRPAPSQQQTPAAAPTAPGPPGPRPAVTPPRQPRGDPPPLPGRRAQADRSTLGGLRRRASTPDPPGTAATPTADAQAPTDPPAPASLADPPAPATLADAPASPPDRPAAATPPPPTRTDPPADAPGPTRDELTKLWADQVLPGLPGRVKAYLSAGRFVDAAGGVATFAVPDPGLLARALPLRAEVEVALGSAAGAPLSLRLVAEGDLAGGGSDEVAARSAGAGSDGSDEDPDAYDLDDLEDAGAAVVSPEQRLLEAFPGAEEVTP